VARTITNTSGVMIGVSLARKTSARNSGLAVVARSVEAIMIAATASLCARIDVSDAHFRRPPLYEFLVFSAMGGVMRAILEGGASPRMVRPLRKHWPCFAEACL